MSLDEKHKLLGNSFYNIFQFRERGTFPVFPLATPLIYINKEVENFLIYLAICFRLISECNVPAFPTVVSYVASEKSRVIPQSAHLVHMFIFLKVIPIFITFNYHFSCCTLPWTSCMQLWEENHFLQMNRVKWRVTSRGFLMTLQIFHSWIWTQLPHMNFCGSVVGCTAKSGSSGNTWNVESKEVTCRLTVVLHSVNTDQLFGNTNHAQNMNRVEEVRFRRSRIRRSLFVKTQGSIKFLAPKNKNLWSQYEQLTFK